MIGHVANTASIDRLIARSYDKPALAEVLAGAKLLAVRGSLQSAMLDNRGRLLLSRAGELLVGQIVGGIYHERTVADLKAMRPEPLTPPAWAWQWPE